MPTTEGKMNDPQTLQKRDQQQQALQRIRDSIERQSK